MLIANSAGGVDVDVSGSRSLTMVERTLATLWDRIPLKARAATPPSSVLRPPSSARSTKSFYTLAMGQPRSTTDVPSRFNPCRRHRHPRYFVTVDLLSRQHRV